MDVSEVDASIASALFGFAILVKDNGIILPTYTFAQVAITNRASEIAIDFAMEVKAPSFGIVGRIGDIFTSQGIDIDSIPRITKEQFYSLE